MKLKDKIEIPKYNLCEELLSAISHGVGGFLSIAALVLCTVFSAIHHNVYAVISSVIYGSCSIILYTMSTLYHSFKPNNAKRVFRILDHDSIFLLIAGTYTPFCLCTLMEYDFNTGIFMFFLVWLMAIVGIVFNAIDLKRYKVFSLICYLVMGWVIIIKTNVLLKLLGFTGFLLLLLGGLFYSVGVIFYVKGKKHKWFHSIFHIFCVIGSLLHVLAILLFVL